MGMAGCAAAAISQTTLIYGTIGLGRLVTKPTDAQARAGYHVSEVVSPQPLTLRETP